MKSRFYYQGHYEQVAVDIREYINSLDSFLTPQTANSPRAVGDSLESLVADQFEKLLGSWCCEYSRDFARRAMADMAFTDIDGFHTMVDVKTHREDTSFNMPNLTSVRRLARLYESDADYFSVIMIKYRIEGTDVRVSDVLFAPIEFLDWQCLTIGTLGWARYRSPTQITFKSYRKIPESDGCCSYVMQCWSSTPKRSARFQIGFRSLRVCGSTGKAGRIFGQVIR